MNESRRQILLDTPHTETATGAIASFETDMVGRAKEVKVEIEAVQEGTPWIADTTESVPYNFRAVKGTAPRIGNSVFESVVGGTVAWNQRIKNGNFDGITSWGASNATRTSSDNVLTITKAAGVACGTGYCYQYVPVVAGHKYLERAEYKNVENTTQIRLFETNSNSILVSDTNWHTVSRIVTHGSATTYQLMLWNMSENADADMVMQIRNVMEIDLTQMFGTTVANYLYTLEQSTPGAGVSWFRKLFPEDYYEYNPGELVSVEGVSSHETVGFNQWDEELEIGSINTQTGQNTTNNTTTRSKNYIKIVPGTNYYTLLPWAHIFWYDANKNFIKYVGNGVVEDGAVHGKVIIAPDNACYMRFRCTGSYGTTYKNDICINLSDPARNGEYEPYTKHSYPLDDALTLRGIPKLDANNNLYYDGDTYASDGTVTRRYGVVDLGTLTWVSNGQDSVFANLPQKKVGSRNVICDKLTYSPAQAISSVPYNGFRTYDASNGIAVRVSGITPGNAKDNLSGMMLVYELATPTTETVTSFQSPQVIDEYGTEEYVYSGTRDVAIPVGHVTRHADIYPISGWDGLTVEARGKNLFDIANAGTSCVDYNGRNYPSYGTRTGDTITIKMGSYGASALLPMPRIFLPSGAVTVSADVLLPAKEGLNTTTVVCRLRNMQTQTNLSLARADTIIGEKTRLSFALTVTDEHWYDAIQIQPQGNAGAFTILNCEITNVQIEIGSTATAYEPYHGSTTPISWADEAGIVYGGYLEWQRDGTVRVTKTMESVDMGTLAYTRITNETVKSGGSFRANIAARLPGTIYGKMLCSEYYITPIKGISNLSAESDMLIITTTATSERRVFVLDSRYSDAASFKSAVSGVQLVYTLEAPITYTLTPQEALVFLRGTNNVWNDINDTTVTYWTHKTGDSV